MREEVDKRAEALLEFRDLWHDGDRRRVEALARAVVEEAFTDRDMRNEQAASTAIHRIAR